LQSGILQCPSKGWCPLLLSHSEVVGVIPTFSFSPPPLQSSISWPLFLLSKPYTQYNGPLLPLPIDPGAIASPCAFTVFSTATLQAS